MTPVGSTRFVGRLKEMWEVHSLLCTRCHPDHGCHRQRWSVERAGRSRQIAAGGGVRAALWRGLSRRRFWLRAYGNDDAKFPLGARTTIELVDGSCRTDSPRTSRAAAAFELAAGVSSWSSAQTTEPRSGDTLGPKPARLCAPTRCARWPSDSVWRHTVWHGETNRGRALTQDRERKQSLPLGGG